MFITFYQESGINNQTFTDPQLKRQLQQYILKQFKFTHEI